MAVSIRVEAIARSAELRMRSAQTMALLLTGLLASVLLVVPNQSKWELGAELIALGAVAIGIQRALDRQAGRRSESGLAHVLDRANPTVATCGLLIVSGLLLILRHAHGFYLLVPALIAVLVGGVTNAWLILVKLAD